MIFLRCAGFEMRWFLVIFKVVIESQVRLKARKPPSRLISLPASWLNDDLEL